MRGGAGWLLLAVTVLSGCAGNEGPDADDDATDAASVGPTVDEPVSPGTTNAPEASPSNATASVGWTRQATAKVGWLVGAGAGSTTGTQGTSDPAHCPDATFESPAGATAIEFTILGATVGPGAGTFEISILGPDEADAYLSPITGEDNERYRFEGNAGGGWSIHADALGPVAAQSWAIEIAITGVSAAEPAEIVVASGCA